MNGNEKKHGQQMNTNDNGIQKKVAERRQEFGKEWELEKQTEGLDEVQGELGAENE